MIKTMSELDETAVFILHAVKQFCHGFETMNRIADGYSDGSPAKGFYMNAIYNYLSIFYLLNRDNKPKGGSFYAALQRHGIEHLLNPIHELMETPIGGTRFGEIIRVFRNKVIVHPDYRDADLDRIYKEVDMEDPVIQALFRELLLRAYSETMLLGIRVAQATGHPLEYFGIKEMYPSG